jgi:hypothetical protein
LRTVVIRKRVEMKKQQTGLIRHRTRLVRASLQCSAMSRHPAELGMVSIEKMGDGFRAGTF